MPDQVILESQRLKLVMWEEGDAGLIEALHSTVEMTRYLSGYAPWPRDKCEDRLQAWILEQARDGCTKYKMFTRNDGRFIGIAGFSFFTDVVEDFVLGFSLAEAEWGKGYATEIASALGEWFFDKGFARQFIAFAHPQNFASLRVLEKIGMRGRMPIISDGVSCPAFQLART
jgi:RimJ/RimL family protein N-acetyltransferase